jgi:hypothetical protein
MAKRTPQGLANLLCHHMAVHGWRPVPTPALIAACSVPAVLHMPHVHVLNLAGANVQAPAQWVTRYPQYAQVFTALAAIWGA